MYPDSRNLVLVYLRRAGDRVIETDFCTHQRRPTKYIYAIRKICQSLSKACLCILKSMGFETLTGCYLECLSYPRPLLINTKSLTKVNFFNFLSINHAKLLVAQGFLRPKTYTTWQLLTNSKFKIQNQTEY